MDADLGFLLLSKAPAPSLLPHAPRTSPIFLSQSTSLIQIQSERMLESHWPLWFIKLLVQALNLDFFFFKDQSISPLRCSSQSPPSNRPSFKMMEELWGSSCFCCRGIVSLHFFKKRITVTFLNSSLLNRPNTSSALEDVRADTRQNHQIALRKCIGLS